MAVDSLASPGGHVLFLLVASESGGMYFSLPLWFYFHLYGAEGEQTL